MEHENSIDDIYLVKAFWPTANAVLIWRDNMFESEREAVETFEKYARSFSDAERPILRKVIRVAIES